MPIFMSGMPQVGVEVLDVLEMDEVNFDLAGLKFSLKNGRLQGLKNSIVDNVKWDLEKKKMEIFFHVDCSVKGHYTAAGRILILPITGDGQMKLKLKNLAITLVINYENEEKEGKVFLIPKSYSFKFDVKNGANFDLTNLFNGNKELSEPMLLFLNENWKQISQEFGGPMMDASAKKLFQSLVAFFSKVPLSDIATF
ncbi:unnamed protein product [Parnassius mnemosyne]